MTLFLTRDPIGEQGGNNLYGFCGNDSVNRVDVLGNKWIWIVVGRNLDGSPHWVRIQVPDDGDTSDDGASYDSLADYFGEEAARNGTGSVGTANGGQASETDDGGISIKYGNVTVTNDPGSVPSYANLLYSGPASLSTSGAVTLNGTFGPGLAGAPTGGNTSGAWNPVVILGQMKVLETIEPQAWYGSNDGTAGDIDSQPGGDPSDNLTKEQIAAAYDAAAADEALAQANNSQNLAGAVYSGFRQQANALNFGAKLGTVVGYVAVAPVAAAESAAIVAVASTTAVRGAIAVIGAATVTAGTPQGQAVLTNTYEFVDGWLGAPGGMPSASTAGIAGAGVGMAQEVYGNYQSGEW